MTRFPRPLAFVLVAAVALVAGTGLLLAAATAMGGMATVEVHDEEMDLTLYVPGVVVEGGVALAAWLAPHDVRLDPELERWAPVVRAALRELEAAPDAVLVEVVDRHDRVRVEKVGRRLEVEVDEGPRRVRLRVPLGSVRRSADRLFG